MKFVMQFSEATRTYSFAGSYTEAELQGLDFSPLDQAVLHQPAATAADSLFSLEIIYRADQERNQASTKDQ